MRRPCVLLSFAAALCAQQSPKFEVASIKPGDPISHVRGTRTFPNRFEASNNSLKDLIEIAYHINENQLDGGPKWIDSDLFNVVAKFPEGVTGQQIPAMMQALLADRFNMTIHRETRMLPAFVLVVAKGGPKLPAAAEKPGGASWGSKMIQGTGQPMATLADLLARTLMRPVVDQTGLTGLYDFRIDFAAVQPDPNGVETLPSIFDALQQSLGLRLESSKAPVEVIVVDRAEKPSEN